MNDSGQPRKQWLLPSVTALAAVLLLGAWFLHGANRSLSLRVPGTDQAPGGTGPGATNPVLAGKTIPGEGKPAGLPGSWPQFRGPNHDGINRENIPLARSWPAGGPRELWAIDAGEGYAGPAVAEGRVYLMDYDREKKRDALRCLSLADGREIWRFAYPVPVKRNHGMSRTVPVVSGKHVVALGPKCHVVCVDAISGELRWGIDLVREYGTTVPPWYAGQCPIVDEGRVILAPGGPDALVLAVDLATGNPLWKTPNPRAWKMTHSSIAPMEFNGERLFVYCADKGVVGVSAQDGRLLWETTDWKISIATVPSPLVMAEGRIFLSGGYTAGSLMLQPKQQNGTMTAHTEFRLKPSVFGAIQHTPVLFENHIYGVREDGRFVCISPDGKPVWTSGAGQQFGLGPFVVGDGLIFAVNDSGLLRLLEATPAGYSVLAQAQVLNGRESWAPLALAGGHLLVRDLTRLICLEVARK